MKKTRNFDGINGIWWYQKTLTHSWNFFVQTKRYSVRWQFFVLELIDNYDPMYTHLHTPTYTLTCKCFVKSPCSISLNIWNFKKVDAINTWNIILLCRPLCLTDVYSPLKSDDTEMTCFSMGNVMFVAYLIHSLASSDKVSAGS